VYTASKTCIERQMAGKMSPGIKVRRFDDARCMGNYSVRYAVCKLCQKRVTCEALMVEGVLLKREREKTMNPKHKAQVVGQDKPCQKCLHVKRLMGHGEYDQCLNSGVQTGTARRRYCVHERTEPFDGRYILCGDEGRLWEPRPPTKWGNLLAHIAFHILGPEEYRAKKRERGGLMGFLREAIKGPDKVEGGEQGAKEVLKEK